ncbi:MAG TPA: hypothetical protein VMZ53_11615 [Kofleriaceae bacterium]|nr:hypothetical protein [Kofleriaceae bacterium]
MRICCAAVLLSGCGRLGFDARVASDAPDATDAAQPVCPVQSVPSTITVSGDTFRYTTFTNMTAPIAGATVQARDRTDLSILATVTSDGSGAYSLSYSTDGDVTPLALIYAAPTYNETIVIPSVVDRDIMGMTVAVFSVGDGPLWNDGALDSVYSAYGSGLPRDATLGTINVAVRDCDGNPLEGASVTFDRTPDDFAYQRPDGAFDLSLTATVQPYTHLVAFNMPLDSYRVSAQRPGYRFTDESIFTDASATTLVVIRGALAP